MKNLLVMLVIIVSLLVSCTNENIDENTTLVENSLSKKKSNHSGKMIQTTSPENPDNPYDIAGKIHNDILDSYLTASYPFTTMIQISHTVDSISALNNDFTNLQATLPLNFGEIQETVDSPQLKLEQAIANSGMTNAAKICLADFMASIVLWETGEYEVIHPSIISFETSVINNTQFTNEDKRIILTTSSIARYSIYYAKEIKDKDWETSVGNRVGALQGAIANSSTAVNRSVLTGIIIQNLQ
ncbi:hypothetical protein [Flavobacterium sp. 245]|uniref:hypothetical protein n=1 Tax=Flavobacterium sp. 245 TaxID=2512115 RepID=UPI00105CF68F|nr:hypothetical protein [Flavobacterium sp. 245]TDP00303.1 hypothetical protein EV145_106197 [Flavobacterium sp. 245]